MFPRISKKLLRTWQAHLMLIFAKIFQILQLDKGELNVPKNFKEIVEDLAGSSHAHFCQDFSNTSTRCKKQNLKTFKNNNFQVLKWQRKKE
jgi:hypothetical protein